MNLRKAGHRLWNYLFEKSLQVSGFTMVGLAAIDISNFNDVTISAFGVDKIEVGRFVYYLFIAMAAVFGYFSINNAKEIEKMEREISEKGTKIQDLENTLNQVVVDTNELFNSYLKLLIGSLGFTHNERISVYKVYEGRFILIGRTSTNPTLKAVGRSHYPVNEGFIGKGWAEGECFIDDLPDPQAKKGEYNKIVSSLCQMDKEALNKIKMKSRTYFVYRINGYDNEPNAVIVVESLNANAFTKEAVLEKVKQVLQPLEIFAEKNNSIYLKKSILAQDIGL